MWKQHLFRGWGSATWLVFLIGAVVLTVPVSFSAAAIYSAAEGEEQTQPEEDPEDEEEPNDEEEEDAEEPPARPARRAVRSGAGGDDAPGQEGDKPKIDPEVQKRLNKLMEERAARRAREAQDAAAERLRKLRSRRTAPDQPPPAQPDASPDEGTSGDTAGERSPSTPLNIPPNGDEIPPELKTYSFSFKDATYDQIVEGFARQTGLGVIGEAPRDGKVNFVTTERLTFAEALSRIRMLLFNYKPLEPYWLDRKESHLEVIRVTDKYRFLERSRMFKTVEAYRARDLSDDELALVIYTPTSGSVADLEIVRDFMPDYFRMAPVGGSSVALFGLVRDVNKFLELIPIFVGRADDPRKLARLELTHILPSEAVEKLSPLLDTGGSSPRGATPVRSIRRDPSPITAMTQPEMTLVPDDSQGVLFVKAMEDKIEEIRQLLPLFDVPTWSSSAQPVVIPLENAEANVIIDTVRQVLSASSATEDPAAAARQVARRRQAVKGREALTVASTDDVTLFVHPLRNALVVLGDESAVSRVREIIRQFDVPGPKPVRIAVEHRTPSEVSTQVLSVMGRASAGPGPGGRAPMAGSPQIVPDDAAGVIWVTGSDHDVSRVRELLAVLDTPQESLRVFRHKLQHAQPSYVVGFLREFDREGQGGPAAGGRAAAIRGRGVTVSKFTPDDAQSLLVVVCTPTEWKEYLPLIEQLDQPAERRPPFARLELEHVDPELVINQLSALFQPDPQAPIRYVPTEGAVLVMGARESELADMRAVVAEIDLPVELEQRTFEIRHRDPADVRTAIEVLVADGAPDSPIRRRGQPKAAPPAVPTQLPALTIFEMGKSLIVRTTPERMRQIAALVAELDVEDVGTEVRVYHDFPPGADIEAIAETLASVMSGAPTAGQLRSRVKGTTPDGPRFIPQASARKLVVIARPAQFAEVEQLLSVLRTAVEREPWTTAFVDVKYADPQELVDLVAPLVEVFTRQLVSEGKLQQTEDPTAAQQRAAMVRRPGQTGVTTEQYHIDADVRNGVIVLAAPKEVVDEARRLVEQFDKPGRGGVVTQTVRLANSQPAEMVKAVKEMISATARASVQRRGGKVIAGVESAEVTALSVVEVPGARAVFLQGPTDAVEQAKTWITELDSVASSGKRVKVYQIHFADIKALAELILNAVDGPTRSVPVVQRRPGRGGAMEEEEPFETTKTWTGQELYIQGDLIRGTMIVAAPETKIEQVDAIVEQFAVEDSPIETAPVPSFLYELEHRDAFDAMLDLQGLLSVKWEPPDQLPKVDAAPFGNVLVVKYPDKNRFSEIEEMIRIIDKTPETKLEVTKKGFAAPTGMSARDTATWIKVNHPELDIEIVDLTEEQDVGIEIVKPPGRPQERPHPMVLPLSVREMVGRALSGGVVGMLRDDEPNEEPEEEPADETAGEPPDAPDEDVPPVDLLPEALPAAELPDQDILDEAFSALVNPPRQESGPPGAGSEEKREKKDTEEIDRALRGSSVKIYVDNVTGAVIVEGPAGVVEKVPDWITDLRDEIEELPRPPDFRVVRVRYIDVYTAADILEEMLNATRAQRNQVLQQQRLMQQQQAMLRAQQLRQQQAQQQQQARGQQPQQQRTDPRTEGQQQAAQQAQMNVMQLPPAAVRIYPNPRDRTLILRADSSQYPAIFELLATIDQPQPINSEIKVFKLSKLNAAQVAELLGEMLGLDAAPASGGAGRSARRRGARTPEPTPGGTLPQTIMQEMATGPGVLGVDPQDIQISASEETNTIVAVAPPKALEFIGELIERLESENVPQREARYYELKHASVDAVAEYLKEHFESGAPARGGRGEASAKSLNTPSFVPYGPLNLLTVLGTEDQLAEAHGVIVRLDVSSAEQQWRDVSLTHADAKAAAETLTKMFGAPTTRGATGRTSGAAAPGPQFIGDEGGRVLFYSAPEALHEEILATVEKLEAQARSDRELRVLVLTHAVPSKVAEAIKEAYGAGGTGRRGAPGVSPFTISAHDPSKRLFVVADDALFAQIESLVQSLDRPQDIGFEFRIYPLEHASARQVHTQMTKLVTDYLRRLGPQASVEPFSVEVDEPSNALVVLGSSTVFQFLEKNLPKVDNPANAQSPPGFLMTTLKNAAAEEVAQNIARLWNEKTLPEGEKPPQAEANRSMNVLIVRGTQAQIDQIRKELIEPLENESAPALLTETVTLKYAQANVVAESINQIFEAKRQAYQAMAQRGAAVSPLQFTAVVTPDPATNQVIVQAGEATMELIKARIAEIDREDVGKLAATAVRIYPIRFADPGAIVNIINTWAKTRTQGTASLEVISAAAEPATHSVVVTANESSHLIIRDIISGVDSEDVASQQQPQVRLFKLTHADPGLVQDAVTQLFKSDGRTGRTQVSAMADYATNGVIVSATAENLSRIEEMIGKIDTDEAQTLAVHVVHLDNADAEAVTRTLTDMFIRAAPQAKPGQSPPIAVSALQGSKAVLVKSGEGDFAKIREVIVQLDTDTTMIGETVRIVPLLYTDAAEMQTAIEKYLSKPGGPGSRGTELVGNVRISVLSQGNALVVSGTSEQVDRLEKTIRGLDVAGEKGSVPQVIKLTHAQAGDLAPKLEEMFSSSGGARGRTPPSIIADEAGNALLVRAGPTDFAAIEGLLAQLDVEGEAERETFRIVRVAQGINLLELADNVERSINESSRARASTTGRGRDVPSVTVTPDSRSHALLISGNPSLFDDAERMARTLEEMGPSGGKATKILTVTQTPADEVLRLISLLKGEETSSGRGGTPARRTSRPARRPGGDAPARVP